MSSLTQFILSVGGGIVLLLGSAYAWYIYTPAPPILPLSAPLQQATIQVGDYVRTYRAYVPAHLPPNPALLLVLHGSNIDGATMRRWTGYTFDEWADREGFIVLYPDGYKGNWNDCRLDVSFPAKAENIDDMGFMRALMGRFGADQHVDPTRIHAFGYSNGGQLAFRLAIEQPQLVQAVAAVGANLPPQATCACNWQGPTARVMLVSGTSDPIMPYGGGKVTLFGLADRGTAISARATAEHFAQRNGITASPLTNNSMNSSSPDALPVDQLVWMQAGQRMVELYTVHGGGHVVPQPRFRFPRLNGPTAVNLDAPTQAVMFFRLPASQPD